MIACAAFVRRRASVSRFWGIRPSATFSIVQPSSRTKTMSIWRAPGVVSDSTGHGGSDVAGVIAVLSNSGVVNVVNESEPQPQPARASSTATENRWRSVMATISWRGRGSMCSARGGLVRSPSRQHGGTCRARTRKVPDAAPCQPRKLLSDSDLGPSTTPGRPPGASLRPVDPPHRALCSRDMGAGDPSPCPLAAGGSPRSRARPR